MQKTKMKAGVWNAIRAFLLGLFLFATILAHAEQTPEMRYQYSNVRSAMEELLSYHVDQHAMTTELINRSFKAYIEQFDPQHIYLLQSEIEPYLIASDILLKKTLHEYDQDQFTTYLQLNALIQNSIIRARQWRTDYEAKPAPIFASTTEQLSPRKLSVAEPAKTESELQARWLGIMARFAQGQASKIADELLSQKRDKILALFERRMHSWEDIYLFVNDEGNPLSTLKREHQQVVLILKALAHSLDAHTDIYNPDEAYALKIQLEKGLQGVGVVLEDSIDGPKITDMVPGGPAHKCGKVFVGDQIVSINGQPTDTCPFHKVLDMLRGEEGSTLVLGVRRMERDEKGLAQEKTFQVPLARGKVVLEDSRIAVSCEPYGNGIIGKITLFSFYEGDQGMGAERDVRDALRKLKAQGELKGLVLDLRENTGGFLVQAVKVAGLFITSGVVVVSRYADDELKIFRDMDGHAYYNGPMVVLTSRLTASAAEIVAQTLQDYGSALIVGDDRTYGKGTVQHQTITDENATNYFKVSVARYYTVSGKSPQINGVRADIIVPTPYCLDRIGERYLDYPLANDSIRPDFDDTLADIHTKARGWYQKFYTPTVQQRRTEWVQMLPLLQKNSETRLKSNKNFQLFIDQVRAHAEQLPDEPSSADDLTLREPDFGAEDLQMVESVNILKDMVVLHEIKQADQPKLVEASK